MTARLLALTACLFALSGCPGEDACWTYCEENQECVAGSADLTEEERLEFVEECYSAYEVQLQGSVTRQVQLDTCKIQSDALTCN